ncbi:23S rRNA (adenine(2503)-C(2))-methyltransferase RlmN [Ectothiorhodospira mobilis]|uniref:23S rRNA (adenine(2503)-C(2))-methyltransferase RlmN n=1 Tax=Ectothiorhodospira mobilis TaxID=195064 RepID=UPI001EE802B8|nr:23S rRNA (adenine(2503)-C(2))-methyltransferase RlmN [Ectothiorhodospira mobilis]MCG5535679.1 23S rRNA (adenine(2503)-C(2))-methyltransferase RlmN [Ectothiorhodospira mobilis]
MTDQARLNLLGMTRPQLADFFAQRGEKPFRAVQVLKWMHQRGCGDFEQMSDLAKSARAWLAEAAEIRAPEVVLEQSAADGTRKWLLRLDDGNCIETVFIPEEGRGTLCVSSQVGCALGCSFCSTARQGFNRNLTAAEIIGQLQVARQRLQPSEGQSRVVTNVVLMGMGEPLLNFDAVAAAVSLMLEDHAYGLSRRRVTVSTVGVVPGIDRLRETEPVALALSLHAVDDALRDQLVPLNRKYPLDQVLAACRRYVGRGGHHDRITMEYVLLEGVNDSPDQARALARRLRDVPCKINLIPFNPYPGSPYRRPGEAAIARFRDILVQAGYTTITRRPRGDDIDAACGQLVGRVAERARRGPSAGGERVPSGTAA